MEWFSLLLLKLEILQAERKLYWLRAKHDHLPPDAHKIREILWMNIDAQEMNLAMLKSQLINYFIEIH